MLSLLLANFLHFNAEKCFFLCSQRLSVEAASAPWAEGDVPGAFKESIPSLLSDPSFAIALGMTGIISLPLGSQLFYF